MFHFLRMFDCIWENLRDSHSSCNTLFMYTFEGTLDALDHSVLLPAITDNFDVAFERSSLMNSHHTERAKHHKLHS